MRLTLRESVWRLLIRTLRDSVRIFPVNSVRGNVSDSTKESVWYKVQDSLLWELINKQVEESLFESTCIKKQRISILKELQDVPA